jgi:hypothetical protein
MTPLSAPRIYDFVTAARDLVLAEDEKVPE